MTAHEGFVRLDRARQLRLHGSFSIAFRMRWHMNQANCGWVAITMDALRGDVEEHAALMVHGVKVFVIVGKGTHRQRAEFFIRKIRWVR